MRARPGAARICSGVDHAAQRTGVSAYLGDGSQRWPAVHRQDAAALFPSALESAPAGTVLHGVGETGVRLRDIAELIGTRLGLPVEAIAADTATGHFGWIGNLVGVDAWRPVSSPASSWTGVPHTPGCSTTWQQVSSSPARRDTGREPLPGFDRPACPITRDIHVGCRRIRAVRTASAAGLVTARFVQHGRTARHAVRPRLRWVCSGSGVHVLRTQAREVRGWLDRACAQAG